MMRLHTITPLLLTPLLTCQDEAKPPTQGLFSGGGMAFSVKASAGGPGHGRILVKDAARQSPPPGEVTASAPPILTRDMVLNVNGSPAPNIDNIDINAFSSGNAITLIGGNDLDTLFTQSGSWNSIMVSVKGSSAPFGLPGSTLQAISTTSGLNVPGSVLGTYVDDAGTTLPAALLTTPVWLELSADEMGLLIEDVDAIDLQTAWRFTEDELVQDLGMEFDKFYFTVSKVSLGSTPSSWWGTTTPSAATILKVSWLGTRWSDPEPHRTYAQLGLPNAGYEIDAFDLDERAIGNGAIVFSTTRDPVNYPIADQIMINYGGILRGPLKLSGGQKVSERLQMEGDDDLDGLCIGDPLIAHPPSKSPGPRKFGPGWNVPQVNTLGFGAWHDMGLAGTGKNLVLTQSGWQYDRPAELGFATFYFWDAVTVTDPSPGNTMMAPYSVWRLASMDTVELILPISAGLHGTGIFATATFTAIATMGEQSPPYYFRQTLQ